MTEKLTIELPEAMIHQLRSVASRTQRSLDEVVAEFIRRADGEALLEALSDEELLAVCDSQPDASEQEALSELLERNQEGTLNEEERRRLDDLMRSYRTGLVRKAQALKIAVQRGIRPRLS